MKVNPIRNQSIKAFALWEYAFNELGVPRTAQRAVITLSVDDIVRVSCDYFPHDGEQEETLTPSLSQDGAAE